MTDFTYLLGYIHKDYLKTDQYKKAFPTNNLSVGYTYANRSLTTILKERYFLKIEKDKKIVKLTYKNNLMPVLMKHMFNTTF